MRKIVIAGGSGFLGELITVYFSRQNYEVVVISRNEPEFLHDKFVRWDNNTVGDWAQELESAEAVINMSGRTVNCRYTEENKKQILDSRVDSTRAIGEAISKCISPPKVWINASSAAIYGDTGNSIAYENYPQANDFSANVCKGWEKTLFDFDTPSTRKIALRMGLVLGRGGGVLHPLVNLVRLGLGGTIGSGKQYVSWVHKDDIVRVIEFVLENEKAVGPLNCCAPNPISNKEFMRALRKSCGVPVGIPAPAIGVRLVTRVIGTEAELVLKGRRVVSKKLEELGFSFSFPEIQRALDNVLEE